MLKQTQKKIMSVKDFTNRLTFLSNAIEACARAYDSSNPADKVKRRETREGFGMLVFLPPKPSDDHLKIYDNIVCHWHYRRQLAEAQRNQNDLALKIENARLSVSCAEEAVKTANEAHSRAKQSLNAGLEGSKELVESTLHDCENRKEALAEARKRLSDLNRHAEIFRKKAASCQKELDKLWKDRTKPTASGEIAADYLRFAEDVCSFNGKPASAADRDPLDPACFDDIIGLSCRPKDATPTDISRLRTDSSNSTILNEFVIANNVVSPAFAAAGFPPCRTSLVRDTDPQFNEAVMEAARLRVVDLILDPELAFGGYSADEEAGLNSILRPNASGRARVERERGKEDTNILYELVTSEAFPVMVEEMLKPATMEGLTRFGDENVQEDFARKLSVLSYNEHKAREAYAAAVDGLGGNTTTCYAERLKERGEILSYMLCVALLGSVAVKAFDVDMGKMRLVLTGRPNSRNRMRNANGLPKPQALLVEQIPNQEGSYSLGKAFALDAERSVLIGRAPFDERMESIIVPAGCSPYPGLADFAANVSRSHALIEPSPEGWLLSDAGSSYGTAIKRSSGDGRSAPTMPLVDDERVLLRNGDVILLAPRELDGGYFADVEFGFSYRFEVVG